MELSLRFSGRITVFYRQFPQNSPPAYRGVETRWCVRPPGEGCAPVEGLAAKETAKMQLGQDVPWNLRCSLRNRPNWCFVRVLQDFSDLFKGSSPHSRTGGWCWIALSVHVFMSESLEPLEMVVKDSTSCYLLNQMVDSPRVYISPLPLWLVTCRPCLSCTSHTGLAHAWAPGHSCGRSQRI